MKEDRKRETEGGRGREKGGKEAYINSPPDDTNKTRPITISKIFLR